MSFFSNFVNFISNIDLGRILFYFTSSEIQRNFLFVKIAFMIISAILVGIIIFLFSKIHYFQWLTIQDWTNFVKMGSLGAKRMTKQWKKILGRLEIASESEYKLALIEADDMLNSSLSKMGYGGQTIEERLGKLTKTIMPNVDQLQEVHRLRDHIVHDPDYRLDLNEAKMALSVYEKAFNNLQILAE